MPSVLFPDVAVAEKEWDVSEVVDGWLMGG